MTSLLLLPKTSSVVAVTATTLVFTVVAACGSGAGPPLDLSTPVAARVVVTGVELTPDGVRVDWISVRTESGDTYRLKIGSNIEPSDWDPKHLQSHQSLGESLGFTIGVTFAEGEAGLTALELVE